MKIFLALFLIPVFFAPSLYSQTLTDSLKAHYPFDNNLRDVTRYGNNLMVNGGISPYILVAGKDSALSFNGNDRLTSTSTFDASSFTEMAISVWVKTSHLTTTSDQLILQGANIGFGLGIQPVTGKLFASFDGSTAGSRISTSSVVDSIWHNIVMQSNGSTTSLYIDGVFDGSVNETLYPSTGGTDNLIYVGASTFNTRTFTGVINDLRIYNRLLSTSEIQTLYTKSLSVSKVYAGQTITFSVFPNPTTNGSFSIKGENLEPGSTIEITDITGQIVYQVLWPSSKQYQVEPALKSGIYIISAIENGEVRASRKLVVQ
ncbi:LamG-like jellyroll fold domain-containing protein [Owenweeksia hongkongensis]|uniref:LamG-like jellyroll fold domain-containing protein n=1 Tax=Owenweeksia hongkongensis TaxID=253245 RepID=UPI003A94931E